MREVLYHLNILRENTTLKIVEAVLQNLYLKIYCEQKKYVYIYMYKCLQLPWYVKEDLEKI